MSEKVLQEEKTSEGNCFLLCELTKGEITAVGLKLPLSCYFFTFSCCYMFYNTKLFVSVVRLLAKSNTIGLTSLVHICTFVDYIRVEGITVITHIITS